MCGKEKSENLEYRFFDCYHQNQQFIQERYFLELLIMNKHTFRFSRLWSAEASAKKAQTNSWLLKLSVSAIEHIIGKLWT